MYVYSLLADAGATDAAKDRSFSEISSDSEMDEIDDILAFSRYIFFKTFISNQYVCLQILILFF